MLSETKTEEVVSSNNKEAIDELLLHINNKPLTFYPEPKNGLEHRQRVSEVIEQYISYQRLIISCLMS